MNDIDLMVRQAVQALEDGEIKDFFLNDKNEVRRFRKRLEQATNIPYKTGTVREKGGITLYVGRKE